MSGSWRGPVLAATCLLCSDEAAPAFLPLAHGGVNGSPPGSWAWPPTGKTQTASNGSGCGLAMLHSLPGGTSRASPAWTVWAVLRELLSGIVERDGREDDLARVLRPF